MKSKLLILLIPVILLCGCPANKETQGSNKDNFSIYSVRDSIDPETRSIRQVPMRVRTISIESALPLEARLQAIADTLSFSYFNGLKIKVNGIHASSGNVRIANINLVESPAYRGPGSLAPYNSWYDFFQGSSGGIRTTIMLKETFLQRNYPGPWIDGICFFYQGDSIGERDHVILNGLIKR